MRVVLAALLVAALAAGCGDSAKTYNSDDVRRAFNSQGFDLIGPLGQFATDSGGPYSGAAFTPSRGPFIVLVFDRNGDADKADKTYQGQATSQSFEVRKGNVVVLSDDGVTPLTRIRINAALFQLP